MAGVRKMKSSAIDGEEIVIVKKRKQLDEEEEHKGKQRDVPIVKKRSRLGPIVENRNEIDGKEEQIEKERAIVKKRNQFDEQKTSRNETDEDVAIGRTIDEKQEQEVLIVKKRNRLDEEEERALVKIGNEEEICTSLPEELWAENILTRLPARTLARCSFVSKLWYNSYSKDTRFAVVHSVQNRNNKSLIFNLLNVSRGGVHNALFFSLEEDNPKFLARIRTSDICELVGYCNGLACIKEISIHTSGTIAVVNPINSQILTHPYVTPTGGYMYLCHGFGFDSLSQVYKVVMVFTSKDNDQFHYMVITLGTSSWRIITTATAEISPPPGSSPFPSRMATRVSRSFRKQATSCGGDLLWRTTSEADDDDDWKIEMLLSFDLHTEMIQFIRLPDETTTMDERRYLVVDHLLEFKGYPCIARSEKIETSNNDHCGHRCGYQSNLNCCCCCKVHMYILKDKVKQVWIREKTIDVQIQDQEGLLPAPFCCYFETSAVTPATRILTLSDQVLLYWFNGESLILYNLLEKQLKVVKCSRSYPGVFQTKMNETPGRGIDDDDNIDCPYMDYQLLAQVENLVCMKTFIPKGAKTSKYDCFQDFKHAVKGNRPAGCVIESLNSYAFWEDKEVGDEVSDSVEGHPNGSCRSKQSRSKKKSGKAKRTLTAKKSQKVQSTGSELSELLSACRTRIEICKSYLVPNFIPVEEWMAVLEGLPDLDEDLKLDAVNYLGGDPLRAQTFVLVSPNIRKRYLIAKLGGN